MAKINLTPFFCNLIYPGWNSQKWLKDNALEEVPLLSVNKVSSKEDVICTVNVLKNVIGYVTFCTP